MDIGLTWNTLQSMADIGVAAGDLAGDAGLTTAVIISLFTDRPAEPGDVIPDGTGDPRGYWGDAYDIASTSGVIDFTGSRLWLLDRAVITNATLIQAQDYCIEALQWMIDDGVAGSVSATASNLGIDGIGLVVEIDQQGASHRFDFAWANS